jgi:hypothetical protein
MTRITPPTFGNVLARLLMDAGFTKLNNSPDWVAFVVTVPGVSYETLRKAVTAERPVSEKLMRTVATALNVEPTIFPEYRLLVASRELDPQQVGWNRALESLVGWEAYLAGSESVETDSAEVGGGDPTR